MDIPEVGSPVAGEDTVDLANQIEKLGLQVETLIPDLLFLSLLFVA